MSLNDSAIAVNHSSSSASSGATALLAAMAPDMTATWTYLPCLFTFATILSILFNGSLMLVFITDRDLRTPFNVYMMNLLTANFLCSAVQNPLEIINSIYPTFWLGPQVCTLYQYGAYVLQVIYHQQ